MNAVLNAIKKVETFIGVILIILIVLLVFTAAVVRWVGFPIAWSIDVAQLLFGWVVFLGADIALKNDSHIGVDMIINKFPFKVRKTVKIINYIFIQAFLLIIVYYGISLSIQNYQRLFNTLKLSYSYATISVPVGCAFMFLTMCEKLKKAITEKEDHVSLPDKSAW
ncbi:TRAP-type C4-dicarboxylate transport system, small permease component [Clostridium aceticum]|uniref:TRAP-type C4-dicarboxylate transport system, small permease component n=1 Tax=Clostridium aceticum TaxID=84022 RepID=A0A0G3W7J0_9CLOT|nr:TRAP transporter small permease [Clostridium aceticum]AKL94631.1 TRAP-type C4-dicarboxylate transport system, small permease component [Clostridium aceticum]